MHCRYTSSSIANTTYNTLDGNLTSTCKQICKEGKAISLQTWTSPEGSRRVKVPDFITIGT